MIDELYTCKLCKKDIKIAKLMEHHKIHISSEDIIETKDNIDEVKEFIAEGSINIYEGFQRSGKTLTGAIFSLAAYQKRKPVFSTLKFRFPFTPLNFQKLKLENDVNPLENGHAFIDELNFYLDARASMSKVNRDFCKFLLQVKKQGLELGGTTHNLSYLDLRFRQNYDYKLLTTVFPKYPQCPEILRLNILNGPATKTMDKIVKLKVKPFLGLYDTRHVFNAFEESPTIERKATKIIPTTRFDL